MNSLAEEIQRISDDADKCINYPIGTKLTEFFSQQEKQNSPNFVLSGVIIYAASKIFGRKVDCLEQEILGVARNFEKVDAENGNNAEKDPKEGAVKRTRTKKYNIKDGVNIDRILFEEKDIIIATIKDDINKTLAVPSRISRLQKMREFFARNKEKSGKIAIPKSMLMSTEQAVTNFGQTQIHDYDDYKDIVGSRRDFSSFSFFINSTTGELQNDLNFSKSSPKSSDYVLNDHEHPAVTNFEQLPDERPAIDSQNTELLCLNLPAESDNEEFFTPPMTPTTPDSLSGKVTPINLNLDEGIEMDIDLIPTNHLMKISNLLDETPLLVPPPVTFSDSVQTVLGEIKKRSGDFSLPDGLKTEVNESRMTNIFMIPIKKLKHKCLFDLPDSEFRELKRRKLDQHKSTVPDVPRQPRIFKFLDLLKNSNLPAMTGSVEVRNDEDEPFLGFSKEEQDECPFPVPQSKNKSKMSSETDDNEEFFDALENLDMEVEKSSIDLETSGMETSLDHHDGSATSLRKTSNDSGYTSEFINSSGEISAEVSSRLESIQEDSDSITMKNTSGADSCYQSLVSGHSGCDDQVTPNISSFIDDFNVGNESAEDFNRNTEADEQLKSLESEERIQQMRQTAINVAKWKDFLKPILANSERRSKIDMHEYGLKVINKIGNVNESKTFKDISETNQMPAYFFTMLQLTNNRNIDISFTNKSISEPTSLENIKLTLKSKTVHKEKFDEMGQHFEEAETLKKVGKRKGSNLINIQTSTPAKRTFLSSFVDTPSQSLIDNSMQVSSQASSGYFSQNSTFSDF